MDNLSIRAEKQAVFSRLVEYRKRNGVGCFNAVAAKCRTRGLTADTLRRLMYGDAVLDIGKWRAIGRALDRLEGVTADG